MSSVVRQRSASSRSLASTAGATGPTASQSRRSGTVAQTLAILRFLAHASQPMGVNAIARELGMAPSSCFKILKQLQLADFADFEPVRKCYSLGPEAIELARSALDPAQVFSLLRPKLMELTERFAIAIGLWRIISRGRMVLIGFIEGSNPMRIHMSVGQRLPMFVGGVGRAFAAEFKLDEDRLRRVYCALRWQTPTSYEEYARSVADAARMGYAVDRNTFAPGITTVAKALPDATGVLAYGLSAIMFSGQHSETVMAEIGAALREFSRWASIRLIASTS
jgi:DNA-binding IclR family transcriptional regulator